MPDVKSLNRLTGRLAEVCRDRYLDEKWLLAPSLRTAHQWVDAVVHAGQTVVNLHVKTLASLAVDLAMPIMAARQMAVVPHRARSLIMCQAVGELREGGLSYFGGAASGMSLSEALAESVRILSEAGLSIKDLDVDSFEDGAKYEDLRSLAEEYGRLLAEARLADYPSVVEMAVTRAVEWDSSRRSRPLLLLPSDLDATHLEKRLLRSFPEGMLMELHADDPGDSPRESARHLDTYFQRAIGEVNEVRAVLRSCLQRGISFDEVEILYTDRSTYLPLIYETLSALGRDTDGGELPATFAEGIPCSYSRPGRALTAWATWIMEGHAQPVLDGILRAGLLKTERGGGDPLHPQRLADLFRSLGIWREEKGLLKRVDEMIQRAKIRRARALSEDPDSAPEHDELREMSLFRQLIVNLLGTLPAGGAGSGETVKYAAGFLNSMARVGDRLDGFSLQILNEELAEAGRWVSVSRGKSLPDLVPWLRELPEALNVLGSGPRPGRIHVDHIARGGHSGRRHTFIVGLDEGRFPGPGHQDPLLLDSERKALSDFIPLASQRRQRTLEAFHRLTARLRGEVTFSYSCYDLGGDREAFPSSVFLDLSRSASGGSESLPPDALLPKSFSPSTEAAALSMADWWLWRLTGKERIGNLRGLEEKIHPNLARGRAATVKRGGTDFTPWDGNVPAAGRDLDPFSPEGRVLSANALETAGTCPRKFFFRHVLDILPPPDIADDSRCWLDHLLRGSLLHELFERFMTSLSGRGETPDAQKNRDLMMRLLDELELTYRELMPPPDESLVYREMLDLRRIALTFLLEEERYFRKTGNRPLYIEASLGIPGAGGETGFDTREPVRLSLPGGGVIRARGRIDRIDLIGAERGGSYAIWDYKTGSNRRYRKSDPHRQGRTVQPWLYHAMAGERLRALHSGPVEISSFGFFFPGIKSAGERIVWSSQEIEDGGGIVEDICGILSSGAFIATDNYDEDCIFCDYREVCDADGELKLLPGRVRGKVENGDNPTLQPFMRLRDPE